MASNNVTAIGGDPVDKIWESMPKATQQSINAWTKAWKRKLITQYEELTLSVRSTEAQGSMSNTLAVTAKSTGGLKGKLTTRVRKAIEAVEMDMHFSKDGQMVLGLDPAIGNPEDEGGDGE